MNRLSIARLIQGCTQMLDKLNSRNLTLGLTVTALIAFAPAGNAALLAYSQNFEGMDQTDPDVLGNAGWLVFGNVFSSGILAYQYGAFPAPNGCQFGTAAFSCVAAGEGGPDQGARQLVVFSDYQNLDHFDGNTIESNVYQEQIIGASDIGKTMQFSFDAKRGDIGGSSTASAFIKTVDPNNGYALTNFIQLDTTSISTLWDTFSLNILVEPDLDGQLLQFGFLNVASFFESSGVVYDNVCFDEAGGCGVVPVPAAAWLFGSSLGLLGWMLRRATSTDTPLR
jgi:hypothetical protein